MPQPGWLDQATFAITRPSRALQSVRRHVRTAIRAPGCVCAIPTVRGSGRRRGTPLCRPVTARARLRRPSRTRRQRRSLGPLPARRGGSGTSL